jgi:FtsH-binding integral membrane protein
MSRGNEYPLEYGSERSEPVANERAAFIRRTYAHLAGAILAFIAIEAVLLNIPGIQDTVLRVFGGSALSALFIFGAFIVVSMLAQHWASSQTSRGVQYLGLSVYVVLQALIMLPILIVAQWYSKRAGGGDLIPTAGILTLAVFGGLTAVVFFTKKDFSFLGSLLTICSFVALGFMLVAIIFQGVTLGAFFTGAMILLMAGYILYDTSNVMLHYGTDQHVAAALALFASIATLFYWILRLLIILANNRE